jgi:hypothetical protein
MLEFNIRNEYKQINVARPRYVESLIDRIRAVDFNNANEILLNLEYCLIDYPTTPILIDFFLDYLSKQPGNKKLIVKFNTLGRDEIHILHDFFQGGSFFGLDKKIDSGQEVSKWVETINKKLKQHNIIMEINYTTINIHKDYTYGN